MGNFDQELNPVSTPTVKSSAVFTRKARPKIENIPEIVFDESNNIRNLIIILGVSLFINLVCISFIAYNLIVGTYRDKALEEKCVLKHLIQQNFIKDSNFTQNIDSAKIDSCYGPLEYARRYAQQKIELLGLTHYGKNNGPDDYEPRKNYQIVSPGLSDLVMLTQYFDKMIDGPKECLPSKCVILRTNEQNQTAVLCNFNYKLKADYVEKDNLNDAEDSEE